MSPLLPHAHRVAGFVLGLLLAVAPAWAQDKDKVKPAGGDRAAVHRMEIFNGPVRSVHFYADGLSATDRATLGDLQRLENEVAATENLGSLRAQYIRDERDLQRRRTIVQNLLYGNSSSYGSGFYPGTVYGGGFGAGFPLAFAYPYVGTSAFFPGYVGSAGTTTQSLAFGVGDEGVLKTELARAIAAQSSPQYATQVRQEYYSALDRAANDARLAGILRLKKGEVVGAEFGRPVPAGMGLSAGDQVSLVARDGAKLDGKFVRESGDWLTVNTGAEQVTLRKSEIVRFSRKQGN